MRWVLLLETANSSGQWRLTEEPLVGFTLLRSSPRSLPVLYRAIRVPQSPESPLLHNAGNRPVRSCSGKIYSDSRAFPVLHYWYFLLHPECRNFTERHRPYIPCRKLLKCQMGNMGENVTQTQWSDILWGSFFCWQGVWGWTEESTRCHFHTFCKPDPPESCIVITLWKPKPISIKRHIDEKRWAISKTSVQRWLRVQCHTDQGLSIRAQHTMDFCFVAAFPAGDHALCPRGTTIFALLQPLSSSTGDVVPQSLQPGLLHALPPLSSLSYQSKRSKTTK